MPAEVRTRWMIGGTIRPKPEDQSMCVIDRKIRHTGWSSTQDDSGSSEF
jgi:hypothetical protein